MNFDSERFEENFGCMFADWPILTLNDICLKEKGSVISGPFGSNISSKYFVESGVPVIRGNNVKEDLTRFVDDGFVFVTKEKADELNTYAKADDLIFTAAGTIGQVGIITTECKYGEYVISNKQLRARTDNKIVDPLFAYYWFASSKMNKYIKILNTGSTIPLINLSVLRGLPIPVPNIDIQKKIVNVLDILDKKIEVNNQINKILKSMAQEIFKYWFVDFEFPNEVGEPYKSSGGEMVESELGMIPKGWQVKTLGSYIKFIKGKKPTTIEERLFKGSKLYLTIDVLNRNSVLYCCTDKMVKADMDDILMVMDGASSGTLFYGQEGVVGSTLAKIEVANTELNNEFIYCSLKFFESEIKTHTTGSAIPHTDKEYINRLKIMVPHNQNLIKLFNKNIRQIKQKITNNEEESMKLKEIRDTLLPKLMSGEIRVPLEQEGEV